MIILSWTNTLVLQQMVVTDNSFTTQSVFLYAFQFFIRLNLDPARDVTRRPTAKIAVSCAAASLPFDDSYDYSRGSTGSVVSVATLINFKMRHIILFYTLLHHMGVKA